jgi:hypothetical protein
MASDSRPPTNATIVMLVQPEQLPVIEKTREPRRLLFTVRAAGEQWEVTFGDSGETRQFELQPDALQAARVAARKHWAANTQPSGVALETEGGSRLVALYGTENPA